MPVRFLRSLYGHLTMFARSPHGARAICTIVRASYEHRADIIRCPYGARSRSMSSLVYHHSSRWNDRDEDAVNRCSSCEAGEPKAAVVAGSEETRLSGCCHPLKRSEEASAAEKAHDVGKAWLLRRVTLGHYDTLMQELMRESRGDFKSFLRMEPEMFDRVAPRIEKSQEGRPRYRQA